MRWFFQSNRIKDSHDILTFHFKEQCKVLHQIHTTMPNARSLHDQPSMRVKANGAIILDRSHHMSLDWTPAIISKDPSYDEECKESLDANDEVSVYEHHFLSAAPLRRPSNH